ncbi:MAG: hypothetical protein GC159_03025 [Phycisphaera sp.]|nr:hypothetical protein [Phycisphaera sp.]
MWVTLLVTLCLIGCKTTETTVRPASDHDRIANAMAMHDDVTLRDLASPNVRKVTGPKAAANNDTPPLAVDGADGVSVAASPSVTPPDAPTVVNPAARQFTPSWMRIEKQLYPQPYAKLDLAMSMLSEPAELETQVLDRWKANGLHVGVIDATRLPLFRANLQRPMTKLYDMAMANDYTPLTLVHRIDGVQQVRFAGADGKEEPIKLIAGEWQMLIKLMPPLDASDNSLWIDILPHHFGPRPTILPQRPDQRMLDGRSFSELRIAHRIKPGEVWMIWADVPEDVEKSQADKKTGGEPTTDDILGELARGEADVAKTDKADATKRPEKRPLRLGEAMLTGKRGTQPVQLVLMFYLEDKK